MAMNTERRESRRSTKPRTSKKDFPTRLPEDSDLDDDRVRGSISSTADGEPEDSSYQSKGKKKRKKRKSKKKRDNDEGDEDDEPSLSHSKQPEEEDDEEAIAARRAAAQAAAEAEDMEDDGGASPRFRLGDIGSYSDEEDDAPKSPPRGLLRPKSLADQMEGVSERKIAKSGISAIRTPKSVSNVRKKASKSVAEALEREEQQRLEREEKEREETNARREEAKRKMAEAKKNARKPSIIRKPSSTAASPRAAFIMDDNPDSLPETFNQKSMPDAVKRKSVHDIRKDSIRRKRSLRSDGAPMSYGEMYTASERRRMSASDRNSSRSRNGSVRGPRVSTGDLPGNSSRGSPGMLGRLRASSGVGGSSAGMSPAQRLAARTNLNVSQRTRDRSSSAASERSRPRQDSGNNAWDSPKGRARSNSARSPARSPKSAMSSVLKKPKRFNFEDPDETTVSGASPRSKSMKRKGLQRPKSLSSKIGDDDEPTYGSPKARSPKSRKKAVSPRSGLRRPKSVVDRMVDDEDDGPR